MKNIKIAVWLVLLFLQLGMVVHGSTPSRNFVHTQQDIMHDGMRSDFQDAPSGLAFENSMNDLSMLEIDINPIVSVENNDLTSEKKAKQNIIDFAMERGNFDHLKQNIRFLELQKLLRADSFLHLLKEYIEPEDPTFDESIEKAHDLLTQHMKAPFLAIVQKALHENKPLTDYIGSEKTLLFSYVMQQKDNDVSLNNLVLAWISSWSKEIYNNHKVSPLRIAAQNNHEEIVKILITAGADIHLQNNNGVSPLWRAAEKGHEEIVNILVVAGADINLQNNDGASPLCKAAQNDHEKIVKILVKDIRTDVNLQRNDEVSPLLIAAGQGHIEIVRILRAAGADINLQDDDGASPLLMAAEEGHIEIVRILIAAGADINLQNNDGASPLWIAVLKGHTEIVNILVDAGANINLQTIHGHIALDIALIDEIRAILRPAT